MMLFEICRILNCNPWPSNEKENNNDDPTQAYSIQRGALLRLFACYKQMKSLDCYHENDVSDTFFAIVCYSVRYFNVEKVNPIDFWSKILSFKEEHADWKPASLLIEICLCVLFSNATLEQFLSQINLIKIILQNRLTNESLNSLLCIRISGISLNGFHNNYLQRCVAYWFNNKNHRVTQRKQKLYKKRENQTKKFPNFSITDLSSDSSVSYSPKSDENLL